MKPQNFRKKFWVQKTQGFLGKRVFIFLIILAINLLLAGFVFGAEKELSVGVQVVGGNASDNTETAGEMGSFKGSIESELTSSSNQNIIQRIFSNGIRGELLSVKVEKNSIIFIFSFLAIFLFMVYIILLVLRIKRVVKKKKKPQKKNSKYL